MFHDAILAVLRKQVPEAQSLETPPDPAMGHYAFPCFTLAKTRRKAPPAIAAELAQQLEKPEFISKIEAKGPYVNFFVSIPALAQRVLQAIASERERFGTTREGEGKTIVVDSSSPNIGKPFHFGHLRSTVIGNALCKLYASQGYRVVRVNHLGDWGTQFGALTYAIQTWGTNSELTVRTLVELYVRFHQEAKVNPVLEEAARERFKELEDGDPETTKLWQKIRGVSLAEFQRIYRIFGIDFDTFDGEAFYNDKIEGAIAEIQKRGLTATSDGALVVPIKGFEVPLMLRKSDGASTYAARDIAAILYRIETYVPERVVYVVGREQALHFQQLFALAEQLGYPKEKFAHIDFGLYLSPEGGKIGTRRGGTIIMEDVLKEATELALQRINEKNPDLPNKESVAPQIAVGGIVFGDLSVDRIKDITFDLNRIVDFDGDTGPYLQYTHARTRSILRKAGAAGFAVSTRVDFSTLTHPAESKVLLQLNRFPRVLSDAARQQKPHILSDYLIGLGHVYNAFYENCPIIQETDKAKQSARLLLADCVSRVLTNGLRTLGIVPPEEM